MLPRGVTCLRRWRRPRGTVEGGTVVFLLGTLVGSESRAIQTTPLSYLPDQPRTWRLDWTTHRAPMGRSRSRSRSRERRGREERGRGDRDGRRRERDQERKRGSR